MRRFLVAAVLAGVAFAAAALPSVDEVQAELAKGNYVHAEAMMHEVVEARPGSARAHYVYAEILAHDKRFGPAAEQLSRARAIDPALTFTQPDKFRAFEQLLQREQAPLVRAEAPLAVREGAAAESGGVPGWAWGLGLAALGLVAWRAFGARRAAAPGTPGYGAGAGPGLPVGAPAGGYGTANPAAVPPAAAAGSGLLGTGLAVAGGVAAGMLAEKLLSGHPSSNAASLFPDASRGLGAVPYDGAGADSAARELQDRPVDFGNGDGWGGGDAAASDASGGGWD